MFDSWVEASRMKTLLCTATLSMFGKSWPRNEGQQKFILKGTGFRSQFHPLQKNEI